MYTISRRCEKLQWRNTFSAIALKFHFPRSDRNFCIFFFVSFFFFGFLLIYLVYLFAFTIFFLLFFLFRRLFFSVLKSNSVFALSVEKKETKIKCHVRIVRFCYRKIDFVWKMFLFYAYFFKTTENNGYNENNIKNIRNPFSDNYCLIISKKE